GAWRKANAMCKHLSFLTSLLVMCNGCTCTNREEHRPAEANEALISCTIRADPVCKLGESPTISVEIKNGSDDEIYLVRALDASDYTWRFPYCYFEVLRPDGRRVPADTARCGSVDGLEMGDFVKVAARGRFDPHQREDDSGP